jgi:nicotinic acid mononucleotide adenylyltransferase
MIKNVALYGGSFDPPHKSHIALIRYLQKIPFIDEVWLLPCGDRNDKKLLLSKISTIQSHEQDIFQQCQHKSR